MYIIKKRDLVKKIFIVILSIFLITICVGPLIFITWNSFKDNPEYSSSKFAPPKSITPLLENVNLLVKKGIFTSIKNSVITVSLAIILDAIFCSMAGFAFSKLKFPGRSLMYLLVIGLLALPLHISIIPLYVMFANLNLINNVYSLAVLYSVWGFPFGTFLMASFYKGISSEIIDSAKIDGANDFNIYSRIMLPLGKPAIITVCTINFFWMWNELFVSMVFNLNGDKRLITPYLALYKQTIGVGALTNWPLIFAGSAISLVIPMLFYFVLQNRIVKGLTAGAIKG